MKRLKKKFKKLFILTLTVGACALFVTTAWGALSFVKPKDATVKTVQEAAEVIPATMPEKSKSRAPEPSSMVLFGSGLLGMLASTIRKAYLKIKRAFDIASSLVGFIVLSPLFLFAFILIKITSPGPVLFKQTRVGKDGKLFEIFKFRTMKVDAEKETGPVWAAKNDNRLIPCGDFLRKAHIDELPQLINIFKGEMSLIGPRPERPVFVKQFVKQIPDYEKRLDVLPGLTGLAQVFHKYDETIEDVKQKIKYDLLYIKRCGLWTDLRILLRTFRVVFTGEGAH